MFAAIPLTPSLTLFPYTTSSDLASIVARPVSVERPPWFETRMPSTPWSTHSRASSCVSIPLMTSLPVIKGIDTHRSEEHTSELQSLRHLVCRLLLEKKKNT